MAHSKTCPQCGNDFEGRSNKVYCSDKCKMAAFKENQVSEDGTLYCSDIESKGFFEAKCTSYTINEDPREELEAEIE